MIFQASYRESGLGLRCSTHGSRTDFVQSYGFDSGPSLLELMVTCHLIPVVDVCNVCM